MQTLDFAAIHGQSDGYEDGPPLKVVYSFLELSRRAQIPIIVNHYSAQ